MTNFPYASRQELQKNLVVFAALKDGHRSNAPLSYLVRISRGDYPPYFGHAGTLMTKL